MSRIRQQLFLVGLMVAFTAAYSALAPISFGKKLHSEAGHRGRRLFRRTRRRFARARGRMVRTLSALTNPL